VPDNSDRQLLRRVRWVLRVGVALEFAGHGLLALGVKSGWLGFITFFGFSDAVAPTIMRAVGTLDLVLALSLLVRPTRAALLWMTTWALFTATLRPLTGFGLLDLVERGANVGAPLALFLLYGAASGWLTNAERDVEASPPVR